MTMSIVPTATGTVSVGAEEVQAGNAGRGGRGAAADVMNGSASCAGARCRGPGRALRLLAISALLLIRDPRAKRPSLSTVGPGR